MERDKKKYDSPACEVVAAETEGMFCLSTVIGEDAGKPAEAPEIPEFLSDELNWLK